MPTNKNAKAKRLGNSYAFPLPHESSENAKEGMSLFAWLVGQALAGVSSTGTTPYVAAEFAAQTAREALVRISAFIDEN